MKQKKMTNRLKNLLAIKDKPSSIAKGLALGSFIGMMPIPGFQMMVSLLISSLLRINRKAACIAVFNTNLLTGTFFFAFNFWLGQKILGLEVNYALPDKLGFGYITSILGAGRDVFISLATGGLLTGSVSAFVTYKLALTFFKKRDRSSISKLIDSTA